MLSSPFISSLSEWNFLQISDSPALSYPFPVADWKWLTNNVSVSCDEEEKWKRKGRCFPVMKRQSLTILAEITVRHVLVKFLCKDMGLICCR